MKITNKYKAIGLYGALFTSFYTGSMAKAAVIVTLFDPGIVNSSESPVVPDGIDIGLSATIPSEVYAIDSDTSANSFIANNDDGDTFTTGIDLVASAFSYSGVYYHFSQLRFGASEGDQNYANISFDANDGIYEAVAQFRFDAQGGGSLIALAIDDEGNTLSISEGASLINAARIPEPSGAALLLFGAGLLAIRRVR